MAVLGIETSCDETAVGVVSDGRVLSNMIASQCVHEDFGGVVPEIASREHERLLGTITESALSRAELSIQDIETVAVTYGPGLMGSLLVGVSFGKGLAMRNGLPLYGINHIEAHLLANLIDNSDLTYPFLCMLASGGHTQIIRVDDYRKYSILGTTVDDAAGEAFDKVARLLELGYPGGPYIEKHAQNGDPTMFDFPRGMIDSDTLNFSFSGLKTAVLYAVKPLEPEKRKELLSDICASFQAAVFDSLEAKIEAAVTQTGIHKVTIAGGVAANSELRKRMESFSQRAGCKVYYPDFQYCTDNGGMIAYAGWLAAKHQLPVSTTLTADPRLSLTNSPCSV